MTKHLLDIISDNVLHIFTMMNIRHPCIKKIYILWAGGIRLNKLNIKILNFSIYLTDFLEWKKINIQVIMQNGPLYHLKEPLDLPNQIIINMWITDNLNTGHMPVIHICVPDQFCFQAVVQIVFQDPLLSSSVVALLPWQNLFDTLLSQLDESFVEHQ